MQTHLLQVQEDRIGTVQRAQAALGEAPQWTARRLGCCRDAKLQLPVTPFFKDAENVTGVTEVKTGKWFQKREDAV